MKAIGKRINNPVKGKFQFDSPEVFKRLLRNKLSVIGLILVMGLLFVSVFASFLAPNNPVDQQLEWRLLSPSWEYPLGTDNLGRCILSRLIYGTRVSLMIGSVVVGISTLFGIIVGLISGYFGGIVDDILMRIVDILLAIPGLILVLVITGLLGPGLFNVMLALSMVDWTRYARLVRGCVLSTKEKGFVEAAEAIGCSNFRIIFRYILPEAISPVIVMATLSMGWTILSAAALSFLGLGAQPPMPEWGSMLNSGRAYLRTAPHLTALPGCAIMITVFAFNFVGDGLRDALDPRYKKYE
jgi:peptide/nickel transport system permease protein